MAVKADIEREKINLRAKEATKKALRCKDCFWYKECSFIDGGKSPFACCGCNAVVFYDGYVQALLDSNFK